MYIQNCVIKKLSATNIQDWLVTYLADLLAIEPEDVDVTVPFDRYGLDSSAAIVMTGDLQDWLGKEVAATVIYDYPTVEALIEHLTYC
ncbi:MAG: acyl carrier protein [Waterburya sp.]